MPRVTAGEGQSQALNFLSEVDRDYLLCQLSLQETRSSHPDLKHICESLFCLGGNGNTAPHLPSSRWDGKRHRGPISTQDNQTPKSPSNLITPIIAGSWRLCTGRQGGGRKEEEAREVTFGHNSGDNIRHSPLPSLR